MERVFAEWSGGLTDRDLTATFVPPQAGSDEALPAQIGRYRIQQRELGRGAFGVVHLSQDPKLEYLVAIKTAPHLLDEIDGGFKGAFCCRTATGAATCVASAFSVTPRADLAISEWRGLRHFKMLVVHHHGRAPVCGPAWARQQVRTECRSGCIVVRSVGPWSSSG